MKYVVPAFVAALILIGAGGVRMGEAGAWVWVIMGIAIGGAQIYYHLANPLNPRSLFGTGNRVFDNHIAEARRAIDWEVSHFKTFREQEILAEHEAEFNRYRQHKAHTERK